MKANKLIELIKDKEDFDVCISISTADGTDYGFSVCHLPINGIADIGHSSKSIVLNVDEEEIRTIVDNLINQRNSLQEKLAQQKNISVVTVIKQLISNYVLPNEVVEVLQTYVKDIT